MTAIAKIEHMLRATPQRFLVTGVAGFIGSHLASRLVALGQEVVGVDNLSTGTLENVRAIEAEAAALGKKSNFRFFTGDVCDLSLLQEACKGVQIVLHQAALGSVKRSVEQPIESNKANVEGTLSVFFAAHRAGIRRVVYASSSSVYGDSLANPKREEDIGEVLSPYAATKAFCETYARLFSTLYGVQCIGLRYFNVFGPRQNPKGEYAAVIPRWIEAMLKGERAVIYGDGKTSRDFCYIDNVVQANLLAAFAPEQCAGRAYNIALGDETTLYQLYCMIREQIGNSGVSGEPEFADFRVGDIRQSRADITRAKSELGYAPDVRVKEGLLKTINAYRA